jgi:hexosaminidase
MTTFDSFQSLGLCLFLLINISRADFSQDISSPKIYPACKTETYSRDSNIIGVVKPSDLLMPAFGPDAIHKVVAPAIHRFRRKLLELPDFEEDCTADDYQLQSINTIEIHVSSANIRLLHGVDESYDISIQQNSSFATLKAVTVFGIVRGLETLGQLLEFGWTSKEDKEQRFIIEDIPLSIQDTPSFEYRGLLIDTSRHYLPLTLIYANLDAMAMNKLNVLHWHLTDSNSFPYKAKSMPELAEKGAYYPKLIYTTVDIQNIVDEAYLRGIRVIPEIDMPGHSMSIGRSHPELLSPCLDSPPWFDEPLDPTNPKVYDFVEALYKDLIDIFPDQLIHVGGDEVNLNCWKKSKQISKWMKDHNMTDEVQLYEYFETRLLSIVNVSKKTPIVWQEVFNLNLTISDDTIVDVWKGFDTKTIEQATNQSFRVIVSGCWYLDNLDQSFQKFYTCDPRNFTGNHDLVIGGHASMWGEHVDAR